MKDFHNFPFFILCVTLFSTTNISADITNLEEQHTYKVDLNNPGTQSDTTNNTQRRVSEKHSNNDELKIILFDQGRAVSLDATTLSNTRIVYGNTEQKKQKTDTIKQHNHSTDCKSSTSGYRHYSTKESGAITDTGVQQQQHQEDDCNH